MFIDCWQDSPSGTQWVIWGKVTGGQQVSLLCCSLVEGSLLQPCSARHSVWHVAASKAFAELSWFFYPVGLCDLSRKVSVFVAGLSWRFPQEATVTSSQESSFCSHSHINLEIHYSRSYLEWRIHLSVVLFLYDQFPTLPFEISASALILFLSTRSVRRYGALTKTPLQLFLIRCFCVSSRNAPGLIPLILLRAWQVGTCDRYMFSEGSCA